MALNAKQKKYLKGLGHTLSPVVTVADKGLTENVMLAIEEALDFHELIKVKVRQQRDARTDTYTEICDKTNAMLVNTIGMVLLIYRPSDKNKVELPGFKSL
ncbi:MAG: ribosome assembly RNA-binding protein YhbY [Enterobacterales bacterium]|nr:ribosome assembly RNA-binding protein YhbY [Enterobacterales bacterium]